MVGWQITLVPLVDGVSGTSQLLTSRVTLMKSLFYFIQSFSQSSPEYLQPVRVVTYNVNILDQPQMIKNWQYMEVVYPAYSTRLSSLTAFLIVVAGFTMYTTCVIWLAFVPLYFGTGNNMAMRITSMSVTISLSASVTIACLFTPKVRCYLVVVGF